MRKRFSRGISFDIHYTFGKTLGISGGDIGAYYGSDNDSNNIQDFNNPRADRGANPGDMAHRFVADWVYAFPRLANSSRLVRGAIGRAPKARRGPPQRPASDRSWLSSQDLYHLLTN